MRVGVLGKPNGLDGHIGIYIEPEDLVYLEPDAVVLVGGTEHTVRSLRQGKKGPQVAFVEVTERSQAEAIRGSEVHVGQRRELGESEFWPSDLVGLEVRPGGGVVTAVTHGAAQDRLEIERGGVVFEVPFVEQFVPVVDIDAGYVEVVEIDGLIPPSAPE
ncbi:MAG TPA: hypothetical protein VFS66_11400 [Acidimicrobiia bacterium]|nr:hypothetical protein [Acidimicrobiia bacterium]